MSNVENPNVPNELVNRNIFRQLARNSENAFREFGFRDLNLFRVSCFEFRIWRPAGPRDRERLFHEQSVPRTLRPPLLA
jgi:hypothetical protein